MIPSRDVLAFVGECSALNRAVDATKLTKRFPQLSQRAAALQLSRLAGYGLVAPSSKLGPEWTWSYRVTDKGRRRIQWHQLGSPRAAAGGSVIDFR